jgi:hypothetical protein
LIRVSRSPPDSASFAIVAALVDIRVPCGAGVFFRFDEQRQRAFASFPESLVIVTKALFFKHFRDVANLLRSELADAAKFFLKSAGALP